MERIDRDELYLKICDLMAERSFCGRLKVGSVIVRDNRIISTGYNGPPSGHLECHEHKCDINESCSISIHAEINAICFAAKHGVALEGAHLYCKYSPCKKCAEAIIQSGITKVIFKEIFRDKAGLYLLAKGNVESLHLYMF